jgi:perosamine synthetase
MRNIPFARPYIGDDERKAAEDVLLGHILVHGPRIQLFEEVFAKWAGAKQSIAVSSCTAGLHLAYFNQGVGRGDEVIVPAMTHVATAHAVEYVGAKPVFVDAEIKTGNIDIDQIEKAITKKTKALSLVHYLGMPVDMDRVNEIAQKHNLFVVEDCALAFGSKYKKTHVGLLGDIGLFSMYPVKHITTLEGGLVLSRHAEVLEKISFQRAFGVDRTHANRSIPGQYDVTQLGFNYRMNELQAAIGNIQVGRLNTFLKKRKKNYEIISSKLNDVEQIYQFTNPNEEYQTSYYSKVILLQGGLEVKRIKIIEALANRGIGTSIYYPRSVPDLTYYKNKYGCSNSQFPQAAKIANQSIALPVGPHLQPGDAEYLADSLIEIVNNLL